MANMSDTQTGAIDPAATYDSEIAEQASPNKPAKFRFMKQSGPELFAGAGSAIPEDPRRHPAFYERVPLMEVMESLLARAYLRNRDAYEREGKFHIAEAGTYRGRGLLTMLNIASSMGINVHITGLDSFEGLPPLSIMDAASAPTNAAYLRRTLFADVTEREVHAYIGAENADRYTLVRGFFEDTLHTLPEREYLLAVIDCDLYSSHIDCMAYFYERVMPGGIIFFDDYHSSQYPMAKLAIDSFLADKPEELTHMGYATPRGNNVKTYIVKS